MHQVLAYSAALINANGFTGLGSLSEELLEHNNKNLRRYRECLARKTTQYANLSDILSRLWIKSDPIVWSHRNAIKCSACNEDHSIRSCPRKHVSGIGCQTIEEHLISTIINPEVAQIAETEVQIAETEVEQIAETEVEQIQEEASTSIAIGP